MCGIIGRVGDGDSVDSLLAGLHNLEYRGYDSAGIAVASDRLDVVKCEGDIDALESRVSSASPRGTMGIGHTRWSTHGAPTDANAHPHVDCTGTVAVVHNGIVENHADLRRRLESEGHVFTSETDTEVVPHLVERGLSRGLDPEAAFRDAVAHLEGSYALATLVQGHDELLATRRGSPLVLGVAEDEYFLASDVPAFLEHTNEVVFLDDGEVVAVGPSDYRITDRDGTTVERDRRTVDWRAEDASREGHDHYMLKEIFEQPTAVDQAVRGRIAAGEDGVRFEDFERGAFEDVSVVHLLACGTSYHASLYVQQLLHERGVDARVHRAGEFTTGVPPLDDDALAIGVTQSGETADTLESLRLASDAGCRTLAVTNVVGSTAARECDDALFIRAGPEIGVAATKTFSSQVSTLVLLAEALGRDCGSGYSDSLPSLLADLHDLPCHVQSVIDSNSVARVADAYEGRDAYFFIGRGVGHPVALEGALKFKEITYEHAEGFAASQLKHGPLALVTERTPVFAVFTGADARDEKTYNNVEEVNARGAPVVAVASSATESVGDVADHVLEIPETHPELAGILANVQLQLVSYHVADMLDRSIDKPRNLAKSVTVE